MVQIAENERLEQEQQQQMSLMPNGSAADESAPSQSYDRNFLAVNLMNSNPHFSRQDPTTFQLV